MKLVTITFVILLGLNIGVARAQQGHLTCAPNCEFFGKNAVKNAGSCVDRTCPVCSKKQKEEREKKEKLDQQKIDDWKAGEKTRQAAIKQKKEEQQVAHEKYLQNQKENEVVLVAPKPNVVANNNTSTKLSLQDQEILELRKNKKIEISGMRDYNQEGAVLFIPSSNYYEKVPNTTEPVGRIFYIENKRVVVLKDIRLKDIRAVGYNYGGELDENGNFSLRFSWNAPGFRVNGELYRGEPYAQIITLQGESLLNDKDIVGIDYRGNGMYELQKRGETKPTALYNFKTKKITPINK